MSRPQHDPMPQHVQAAGQLAPQQQLPRGWLTEWDSNYNIPYYVNLNGGTPHSQWTSPMEDSTGEQQHAAQQGYNSSYNPSYSSSYAPSYAQQGNQIAQNGGGSHTAPQPQVQQHPQQAKHKQNEAHTQGVEEGRLAELRKENVMAAELERVKYENERLRQQQGQPGQGQQYGGWSNGPPPQDWGQGRGPEPAHWGGNTEQRNDGRMGPYA